MLIDMFALMTCGLWYGRCRLSMLVQFWVERGDSNFDWQCELHVHDVRIIVLIGTIILGATSLI